MSLSCFYILETTHNNPNMHIDYKPYLQRCPSLFYMEVLGRKMLEDAGQWSPDTAGVFLLLPGTCKWSVNFFLKLLSVLLSSSDFLFRGSASNMNVHLLDSQQGLQYRCLYDSMCPPSWEIRVLEQINQ